MDALTVISLVIMMIPAYVANSIPVVLGGGAKLDLERKFFDGRRIFGDGKTIRGFFAGVFGGVFAGGIVSQLTVLNFFPDARAQFMCFAAMSLGTMVGDALGSFLKRRFGIEPGKPFIADQLMFLVIALVFAYPFVSGEIYGWQPLAFLFIVTYVLHTGSNFVANKVGLKNVPW